MGGWLGGWVVGLVGGRLAGVGLGEVDGGGFTVFNQILNQHAISSFFSGNIFG